MVVNVAELKINKNKQIDMGNVLKLNLYIYVEMQDFQGILYKR